MSGYNNGYGQNETQAYGQYNPYGQQNPYGAPQQGYETQNPYTQRPELGQQSSSRYDEESAQGGYEMTSVNGQSNDPNRILNEVRTIDREIDTLESSLLKLKGLQSRYLDDPASSTQSPLGVELASTSENIMGVYRSLAARVKTIKQNPESGSQRNVSQVGKVDRRLKNAINNYQKVDRDFRESCQEQIARQYRIVRPDASEAEVREAVEDTNNRQVFSQALISSDRRGQAQSVQQNVTDRHKAIQKIERDMMELAQLFNDLEAAVVQQDVAVETIHDRSTVITDNVAKANTELTGAVDKARAARRKKWICLGIVVLIIIIIGVAVGVGVGVTVGKN